MEIVRILRACVTDVLAGHADEVGAGKSSTPCLAVVSGSNAIAPWCA